MTGLADKIEAATESSRYLLIRAFEALNGTTSINYTRWARFLELLDAEAWLDAAMTLVPEGYYPQISKVKQNEWHVHLGYGNRGPGVRSKAATSALALAAAALRARKDDT